MEEIFIKNEPKHKSKVELSIADLQKQLNQLEGYTISGVI